MFRRLVLLAACLALVVASSPASAQQSATLLLRSGERVAGDLIDMGGSDFTIRVGSGERRIPNGEVVVIDFSGLNAQNLPAAEAAKASGGLLVLKSGELVEGRLDDVGGTRPLRLTIIVGGSARDYHSDGVNRIYLGAPPSSAVASTSQGGGGTQGGQGRGGASEGSSGSMKPGAIAVMANQAWTNTGLTVRQGQTVMFQSSGQVRIGADRGEVATVTGRAGSLVGYNGTLPGVLRGALIGRIGNGRPFGIGDQTAIPMPASGLLYLGVNDDDYADNSGAFEVLVGGGTRSTETENERGRRRR